MHPLDVFLSVIFIGGVALGLYWGVIRQMLALAGLLVGLVVALRLAPEVAVWLSSFVASESLALWIAFALVLIGFSSLVSFLASLLRFFVGLLFLGWLDHVLGGMLGLIQVWLLGGMLVAAFTAVDPAAATIWQAASPFAAFLVPIAALFQPLIAPLSAVSL